MVSFNDLVGALPRSPGLELQAAGDAVRYVRTGNPRFVAPELEFRGESGVGPSPSVILISAPAAVGKSTLAEELAYRTNSPIWDLSRFHVGNDFFAGTLVRHFGRDNLGQVMRSFEEGTGCVVLDAVDEAQLRAGPKNFDAFLGDLAAEHQKQRVRPSLVLLARPITAELVAFALQLHEVRFHHYEVAFFGEHAAKGLIDVYLDADDVRDHRLNRKPFEEFRDALLARVSAALGSPTVDWSSDSTRRFLGYAPVLAAISSYLDVKNYKSATNEMLARRVPENLWALLTGLVRNVLQRERHKTLAGVRPTLQPTADRLVWSGWEGLYGEDEQCARVLARVSGAAVEIPTLTDVPAGLRAEYEDALKGWIGNHPFCRDRGGFANIVFQDYVHAYALAGGRADLCTIVRETLSSEALPSPLLGAFLLTLAKKSKVRRLPVVDALDVGSLYDSMQAFSRRSDIVSLDLAVTETSGIGVGVARFPAIIGDADASQDFGFEFLTGSSPVRFGQQLANAVVDLDTSVELGYSGRLMTIGPDALIACKTLRITAASYRVDASAIDGQTGSAVALIAESIEQVAIPELKVFGDRFSVQVQDAVHPWAPFKKVAEDADVPKDRWEAFSRLRKLLTYFRAHGRGELARYADFVDNILIGSSADGKALLALLLKHAVIERRGDMYFLSRKRLEDFGISRSDLVESRMTPGIAHLLADMPSVRT